MTDDDEHWRQALEKRAILRDEALAKILVKSCRAAYADLRLGRALLVRDSKKKGYFPARLVTRDNANHTVAPGHVRIHYHGRPENEYRDISEALVHYLPEDDNDSSHCRWNVELSEWVLVPEGQTPEHTPLLAYAKVFERTEFKKIRASSDGNFELMDSLGRMVKVRAEWMRQHSTIHPNAVEEAVEEAKDHARFLDLVYGGRHVSGTGNHSATLGIDARTTSNNPLWIPYTPGIGASHCLPAAFAYALFAYAERTKLPSLGECAQAIYERGQRQLKVNSRLRSNFQNLANRIVQPMGYRVIALKFFNALHDSDEAGCVPVVASICNENGFGRCVSFLGNWVFDPSLPWTLERTEESLCQVYGKGNYRKTAWSYCLSPLTVRLPSHQPQKDPNKLCKKKIRRKRDQGNNRNKKRKAALADPHLL